MSNKIYTAQRNKFGNIIVCGDEITRKSYEIIWRSAITRAMIEELTPEQIEGLTHELDNAVMNLFDELKGE